MAGGSPVLPHGTTACLETHSPVAVHALPSASCYSCFSFTPGSSHGGRHLLEASRRRGHGKGSRLLLHLQICRGRARSSTMIQQEEQPALAFFALIHSSAVHARKGSLGFLGALRRADTDPTPHQPWFDAPPRAAPSQAVHGQRGAEETLPGHWFHKQKLGTQKQPQSGDTSGVQKYSQGLPLLCLYIC